MVLLVVLMLTIPLKNIMNGKVVNTNDVKIMSPERFETTENTPKTEEAEPQTPFFEKSSGSTEKIDITTPFKILDQSTGRVNYVDQRDYVIGAVCAEMPPDFHTEALKCQAVAAHTFALYNVNHPNPILKGADFSADPSNWKGYVTKDQAKERFGENFDVYWSKLESAVDAIYGNVMVYQEEPILAAYHSMSTGKTESAANVWTGEPPSYLVPVDSTGDVMARDYETKETFKINTIQNIIGTAYPAVTLSEDYNNWFTIKDRSDSGYVTSIKVGDTTITGNELRNVLGLRSSCFEIENNGQEFIFKVKGYGHGVGLSQYGADYMARQGYRCKEIMEHYYSDAKMINVQ